jgi:hypothetical protein
MRNSTDDESASKVVNVSQEVEIQQRQFRDDVRFGIDQLERGLFNEYTLDQLSGRFDELKDRARRRIAHGKESE